MARIEKSISSGPMTWDVEFGIESISRELDAAVLHRLHTQLETWIVK